MLKIGCKQLAIIGLGLTVGILTLISSLLVDKNYQVSAESLGEGKLICMPADEQSNITNEKYRFNKIKVINKTGQPVTIWVQENLCDFQGEFPGPGFRCDNFVRRFKETIPPDPNAARVFVINVPCNKIGQLDVAQDDEAMGSLTPDCFNTADNRVWEGGIAFTVATNVCPTKVPPTVTPIPAIATATPRPPTPTATPTTKVVEKAITATPTPTPKKVVKKVVVLPVTGFNGEALLLVGAAGVLLKIISMML
ncbi:MAG TPA: hypothetical protein VMW25_05045 [Clostridia bacterium]|nr:hypothetical protein [Clostridia bacterium]